MDDIEKPSIFQAFEHYGVPILGPDRGGWVKAGCPIPDHEDNNPSASINEEAGRWRCHTCDKGGDVFDLIQEIEGIAGFSASRRRAAELFGEGDGPLRGERGGSSLLPPRKRNQPRGGYRVPPWTRL